MRERLNIARTLKKAAVPFGIAAITIGGVIGTGTDGKVHADEPITVPIVEKAPVVQESHGLSTSDKIFWSGAIALAGLSLIALSRAMSERSESDKSTRFIDIQSDIGDRITPL